MQKLVALSLTATLSLFAERVLAGPIDTLAPGHWYEIPNSKLRAVAPCPARNCGYSGVSGVAGIMEAWSGGGSNMKGRGFMPEEPKRDPRIVKMHLKDDQWYLARHPLHLTGDAKTFQGHDNAGVGPGLVFAEVLAAQDTTAAIGLVPCAVGGSTIKLWQKGAKLYEDALRRAKLALQTTEPVKARLRGILWLQGEANANAQELPLHAERLRAMIEAFRTDLAQPDLPFIACTVGEMKEEPTLSNLREAWLGR